MKIQADDIVFGREGVFCTEPEPDGPHVKMPYSGIRVFLREAISQRKAPA